MPQACPARLIEISSRPLSSSRRISLRRLRLQELRMLPEMRQ